MYTMKDTCEKVNMKYETLKFYCNEGLIPNVKRDKNNRRIFDDNDVEWIHGLICLKKCGMSIQEIKTYLDLLSDGKSSIPKLKEILDERRKNLVEKIAEINKSINYIDDKKKYYDSILAGKIEFPTNAVSKKD